ncbi:hypothetical protein Tco_0810977 [Tanacetum coccineum]
MLKKFGLEDSKRMKTPMSSDTKLTKDEECKSVDSTKYRGMIGDIVKSVSTAVHSRIAGVSSVAGIARIVTVVSLYRPSRMHFLKASPFGLVSMYLKKRDCHFAYLPVASIGGRSLEPTAMMLLCI